MARLLAHRFRVARWLALLSLSATLLPALGRELVIGGVPVDLPNARWLVTPWAALAAGLLWMRLPRRAPLLAFGRFAAALAPLLYLWWRHEQPDPSWVLAWVALATTAVGDDRRAMANAGVLLLASVAGWVGLQSVAPWGCMEGAPTRPIWIAVGFDFLSTTAIAATASATMLFAFAALDARRRGTKDRSVFVALLVGALALAARLASMDAVAEALRLERADVADTVRIARVVSDGVTRLALPILAAIAAFAWARSRARGARGLRRTLRRVGPLAVVGALTIALGHSPLEPQWSSAPSGLNPRIVDRAGRGFVPPFGRVVVAERSGGLRIGEPRRSPVRTWPAEPGVLFVETGASMRTVGEGLDRLLLWADEAWLVVRIWPTRWREPTAANDWAMLAALGPREDALVIRRLPETPSAVELACELPPHHAFRPWLRSALWEVPPECETLYWRWSPPADRSPVPVTAIERRHIPIRRNLRELGHDLALGAGAVLALLLLVIGAELRRLRRLEPRCTPRRGAPICPSWLRTAEVTHGWVLGRGSPYRDQGVHVCDGPRSIGAAVLALGRRIVGAIGELTAGLLRLALGLGVCAGLLWILEQLAR